MPAQTAWGLDIGESSIKAVKMARLNKFLEVVRVDMIPIGAPGASTMARETMLISALEEFVRRHDPSDSRVVASIPGRSTFCKLINLPPVETKRIPEIVRLEVKQQIPFPIEDIVWDYVQCKKEYAPGEEIEVNLVAIRKEIVENFVETFAHAGIRLDGLQATPLALFNLVKHELAPDGNVVVVDVGADLSDLVIVEGDRFWPRTLGIAGRHVTKALEEKFEIPFEEAEALKLSAAEKHYQKIFTVVRPVLKDLVTEIHRTIGYYKSLSKDVSFDKIIFLGNATKLAGFEKFFGENLPYKIEVIQGLSNIRVSKRLNLKAFKEYLPGFGVAIGLAIQGLKEGRCQVNLLPAEISGKMRPGKMLAMAGALLSLVLAFAASLVISNVGVAAAERRGNTYVGEKNKNIPPVRQVQEAHNQAVAQIEQMKKIQDAARDNYLKPFEKTGLALHVWNALDSLTPRGDQKEIVNDKGERQEIRLADEDKIYLIKIDYQNVLEKSTVPPRRGVSPPPPRQTIIVEITGLVKNRKDLTDTADFIRDGFVKRLNEHALSAPYAQLLPPGDFEAETKKLFDEFEGGILKKILVGENREELKANLSLCYVLSPSFREKMKYIDPKAPTADPYRYHDLLVDRIRRMGKQPAELPQKYETDNFWDDGSGKDTGGGRYVVFTVIWRINPAAVPPGQGSPESASN